MFVPGWNSNRGRLITYCFGLVVSGVLIWHSLQGADLSSLSLGGSSQLVFGSLFLILCVRTNVRLATAQLIEYCRVQKLGSRLDDQSFSDAKRLVVLGSLIAYTPVPGPIIMRTMFLNRFGMTRAKLLKANIFFGVAALAPGLVILLVITSLRVDLSVGLSNRSILLGLLIVLTAGEIATRSPADAQSEGRVWRIFTLQILMYMIAMFSLGCVSMMFSISLSMGELFVGFVAPALSAALFVAPGGLGVREALLSSFADFASRSEGSVIASLVERLLVLGILGITYGLTFLGKGRRVA